MAPIALYVFYCAKHSLPPCSAANCLPPGNLTWPHALRVGELTWMRVKMAAPLKAMAACLLLTAIVLYLRVLVHVDLTPPEHHTWGPRKGATAGVAGAAAQRQSGAKNDGWLASVRRFTSRISGTAAAPSEWTAPALSELPALAQPSILDLSYASDVTTQSSAPSVPPPAVPARPMREVAEAPPPRAGGTARPNPFSPAAAGTTVAEAPPQPSVPAVPATPSAKTYTGRVLIFTMDSIKQYEENAKRGGPAGEIAIRKCLQDGLTSMGLAIDVAGSDAEFFRFAEQIERYSLIFLDPWTFVSPGYKPRSFLIGRESRVFLLSFFGG